MQKYNNNISLKKKTEISAYHLLILIINQDNLCAKLGITPAYSRHFKMFLEYLDLQKVYQKKTYIYARLSDKYNMHTSSVRRVIFKLLQTIEV